MKNVPKVPKRTLLRLTANLFVCLVGVFIWQRNVQASSISEISIEHTRCYGTCPVYKLTLRSDGIATFVGIDHVDKIGTYTARFGGFDRLAQAIVQRRFRHFKTSYPSSITDMPHTITTVASRGRRKTVDNYADTGPQSLWEIETLIDGIVAQAQWKKISNSTDYH